MPTALIGDCSSACREICSHLCTACLSERGEPGFFQEWIDRNRDNAVLCGDSGDVVADCGARFKQDVSEY